MPSNNSNYSSIREALDADYRDVSDAAIEAMLARQGMDAENMEGFFSDLGKIASGVGSTVLKAAPSILPMAGTIVGGAFGGPLGASLGGSLGSLAGKAVGSSMGRGGAPPPPAAGPQPPSGAQAVSSAAGGLLSGGLSGAGGGSAAGQLLGTLIQPSTIQALMSMALGPAGRDKQLVGGVAVPNSAFSNLLGMLANRASAEYNAMAAGDFVPSYMRTGSGEAFGDASAPDNRAAALLDLLEADVLYRRAGEAGGADATDADAMDADAMDADAMDADAEADAIEAEYDAMDLADLYEFEAADAESD
jgi:hypothetical protein